MDLTASTAKVLVVVEGLPESKQRLVTRLCSSIEQNTDFGVQDTAKGSEQPSMRVNLLAVLLLETEHHLHRRQSRRAVVERADELLVGRDRELSCVFELRMVSELSLDDSQANQLTM